MSPLPIPAVKALSAQACWALLRGAPVARVAVVVDGLPEIFPVNLVVDHGSVVLRTDLGTRLAACGHGARVALEADGEDRAAGEVWSVVLKGRVELVQTVQEMVDTVALPLFPWHAGPKPCYLRVVPDEVTGRRFARPAQDRWATTGH